MPYLIYISQDLCIYTALAIVYILIFMGFFSRYRCAFVCMSRDIPDYETNKKTD